MNERSEGHVASVASTHDGEAIGVQTGVPLQSLQECANIPHAVLALESIIHRDECFSEASAAPYVRIEDRDPQLGREEVPTPNEFRLRLAFRTAMDIHDTRPFAGKLLRIGTIKEPAHLRAIKRRDPHQLRLGKISSIQSASLTLRPLRRVRWRSEIGVRFCPWTTDRQRERIRRRPWRVKRKP